MAENTSNNQIPDESRPVDFMLSLAHGHSHRPLASLEEARKTPHAIVVLDGDWGGQVYATCPVKHLKPGITHAQLAAICKQVSTNEWSQEDDWQVAYQIKDVGEGIWGGMGGGLVVDGLWMHPNLCDESITLIEQIIQC